MSNEPPFNSAEERAEYWADALGWGRDRKPADEPPSDCWEQCTDEACEAGYYMRREGNYGPHYHFKGSDDHPAEMPDDADMR